jgi:hypothetical protein
MRSKFYIILLIVSIIFPVCSDELFEDMDNAINNPQMAGGEMTIEYKTGMVLDGVRDAQYDGVMSVIRDGTGDDPDAAMAASDFDEIVFIQDDTHLWIFIQFNDGSPDITNSEISYQVNMQDGRDPWEAFSIKTDGGAWLPLDFFQHDNTSTQAITPADPYFDSALYEIASGIEIKIVLSDFVNSTITPNFQADKWSDNSRDATSYDIKFKF